MLRALLAFAAFAALLTIIPGLDTMLVIRTAAVHGWRSGMAAGAGIGLGCLCWAVAGGLGITALLAASRVGYDVLRWAGAAYLCYLGVRALLRRAPEPDTPAAVAGVRPEGPAASGGIRALRVGLVTNLLNPKIGVFYVSVLPQFIPHGVAPLPACLALALVHDLEGLAWFALLVFVVDRAAPLLVRPGLRRRLDQVAGLAFIGFGVRLALDSVRRQAVA